MVFGFSVGSIGVGDESYSLHIPFVLSSGSNISIEDAKFVNQFNNLKVVIEKHHYSLYTLKISSFDSIAEAQSYLEKIFASLYWISLKNHFGIQFSKTIQDIKIYEEPIFIKEESNIYEIVHNAGWTSIDGDYDIDKTTIIPEHKRLIRFATGQATIQLDYNPESFISELQECLQLPSLEDIIEQKKLYIAMELYSAYSFEVTLTGRFVKLVTVLESLLDKISVPDATEVLLKEANGLIKERRKSLLESGSVEIDSVDRLRSKLGDLSKESIGYSMEMFIRNISIEFVDLDISESTIKQLKQAYTVRSNLLHRGEFNEDELKKYIRLLDDLIPKLLAKLFLKYAASKNY